MIVSSLFAQDPQFTQFYAAPLYLNPGFAGATLQSRAVFNGRAQWAGISKPFVTYAASFDYNFDKFKSGLGVLAVFDKAGTGSLTSSAFSAIYSYKVNLPYKWTFRPGLQFTYGSRSLDYYKLTFGDQLDLNASVPLSTSETFDRTQRINYFDFSAGGILHNDKFWFGISAHHLNRPDESLNNGKSIVPTKFNILGGVKIDLVNSVYKSRKTREQSITPTFMYKFQGKYDQLDLGFYYNYTPLVIGLWYRGIPAIKKYAPGYGNNDAIAILLGFRQEDFTIGYSYDLTISKLSPTNTTGSHEISISYVFEKGGLGNRKRKIRRKDMVIPCPKF